MNEELQQQITELKATVQALQEQQSLSYRQILRLTYALQGTKDYWVSLTSGGAVTTKLTFKDGILTTVT